jgi:hypothetical protein
MFQSDATGSAGTPRGNPLLQVRLLGSHASIRRGLVRNSSKARMPRGCSLRVARDSLRIGGYKPISRDLFRVKTYLTNHISNVNLGVA